MDRYDLFKQLVPPGSILESSDGGFSVRTRSDNGFANSFITDEALLNVDPRLPIALRIFEKEVCTIESIFVTHMLQLWDTHSYVETSDGDLYGVTRLDTLVFTDATVNIRSYGYTYRIFTSPEYAEEIILPTGPGPVIAVISKEWLNQNRPGWFERYQLSCDLDMPLADTFSSMVAPMGVNASIELPSEALSP